MQLSVVIPAYKRPADLDRCLAGLDQQQRKAEQIVIVLREGDDACAAVVSRWNGRLPITLRWVDRPGQVNALNAGVEVAKGEIVAITDDDAVPCTDWLSRIEAHFVDDQRLGGVGGRDVVHENGQIHPAIHDQVGLVRRSGRLIGNHHTGRGPAREVDHIKGANMSWRMTAIQGLRFDTELRGTGAQVYNELAFSFAVQRRGWRLIYDPAVLVDHYPAQRFDNDNRTQQDVQAKKNAAFNLYVALRRYMKPGFRRSMALLWVHYLGAFGHPGVLRGLLFRIKRNSAGMELRSVTAEAWQEARQACLRDENLAAG